MSWVKALFEPLAVAVYGSVAPGKIGRVLVDQLLDGGFREIIAVNPKAAGTDRVPGVRSLGDLPENRRPVELAIVASPAATVPDVLKDAGEAGTQAAVIITAGFKETGNAAAEEKILDVAAAYGIRLVGPNCAGIVNTKHHLFPTLETRPPVGDVAFVSQSGALGGAVLSWAEEQGVGFSKFISYGNGADLTEIDFLDALREDAESKVVCLYIETVSDGRAFLRAAAELAAAKPLIVIKSGRSSSGSRATLSHTGSMAGSDTVYDAALRQCGAIRATGIEEMFDLCRGFVSLPPMKGRRLAIVTNSGGPGVLAADRAEAEKLEILPPSDGLRERLRERLAAFCGFENPFDLTVQGDSAAYREVLCEVLEEYDGALAINVNVPYLDSAPLAQGVVAAAAATGKPIAASFMAGQPVASALPVLEGGGVPNFATGERAVRVLSLLAERERGGERRNRSPVSIAGEAPGAASVPAGSGKAGSRDLPWDRNPLESEAMDWLETLGFPVIERHLATTPDEAVDAAKLFDRPVAMKVVSPGIVHKSDVGGVLLNVEGAADVLEAFDRLHRTAEGHAFGGVLISPMVAAPVEALVGLSYDTQFGPVVACGLGGIYTETLRDLSLRVAPVDRDESTAMIDELRGVSILRGTRGRVLRDLGALAKLVARLSQLPITFPQIQELDLNPVFVLERGVRIGDVRIAVAPRSSDGS